MKAGLNTILSSHITKLFRTSRDNSKGKNMTEIKTEVVNFDKIPAEYAKNKGLATLPKSVDALLVTENDQWVFIEFKNGAVDKCEVHRKIYDSLIMLIDLGIKDNFDFFRKNGSYVLVYNSEKYKKGCLEHRNKIYEYSTRRANTETKLFELEKLEKYLLNSVHTYTVKEFEEYMKNINN